VTPEPTDAGVAALRALLIEAKHGVPVDWDFAMSTLRSIAAKLERPAVKARIWEDPSLGWYVEARPCTADVKAALGSLPGNDGWCTVTISPA